QAAAALAETEHVYVNVRDAEHEAHVRRLLEPLAPPERVRYFRIPTNDAWVRDHGPIFVLREIDERLAALDFEYNAWGGKYPPYDLDRAAGARMTDAIGVERIAYDIVLEGG